MQNKYYEHADFQLFLAHKPTIFFGYFVISICLSFIIHCLSNWRICIERIESSNVVPRDSKDRFQIENISYLITITLLSFPMQQYKFRYICYFTMHVICIFLYIKCDHLVYCIKLWKKKQLIQILHYIIDEHPERPPHCLCGKTTTSYFYWETPCLPHFIPRENEGI